MCIVVVDDEPELRELLRQLLEDEGYLVRAFAHPVPVMDLPDADNRPELFLIDIMLPGMDGITLAERLGRVGFAATPKIAMSASMECVAQARQSKLFNAAIAKPFAIDDLLDCIESYALS
jgi:CheY-like chemotaxis protein